MNIVIGLVLWLFPVFLIGMTYLISPGYIIPLLNHPIARLAIIALMVVHTGTCGSFVGANLLRLPTAVKVLAGIGCGLSLTALILIPTLGPAVLTIFYALGPVYEGK